MALSGMLYQVSILRAFAVKLLLLKLLSELSMFIYFSRSQDRINEPCFTLVPLIILTCIPAFHRFNVPARDQLTCHQDVLKFELKTARPQRQGLMQRRTRIRFVLPFFHQILTRSVVVLSNHAMTLSCWTSSCVIRCFEQSLYEASLDLFFFVFFLTTTLFNHTYPLIINLFEPFEY